MLPSGQVFKYKDITQALCFNHSMYIATQLQSNAFKSNSIYEVISADVNGVNIYRRK